MESKQNNSHSRASIQPPLWQRDDRFSLILAALVWLLVIMMIVPEGFDYASLNTNYAPMAGSKISRMLWLALLSLSALFLVWRISLAWVLLRTLNPFLLVLAGLAVASVAWSIEPSLTLRRSVRMATFILTAIAFVLMAWHARRYQNVVRPIITLMLLGSIIFGLVLPSLAIHTESAPELLGAWRGLATHKNGLGALASFGVIFWFHAWLTKEVRTLPALAGIGIAGACLLLSRSSTALMATIFVMFFLLMLLRSSANLRPYMPFIVALFLIGVLLYTLVLLNLLPGQGTLLQPIAALTGKDTSFTGRTAIWELLSTHISASPVLGSGYGAYWVGPVETSPSYEFIRRMQGFYPGSAHNGYLEILNDLGWVGLLCLIAYLFNYVLQSLRLFAVDRNQAALYLALLVQQGITNLSETHWFSVLSIDFVIMALATTALARNLLEYQLRSVFGEPPPPHPWSKNLAPLPVRKHLAPRQGSEG